MFSHQTYQPFAGLDYSSIFEHQVQHLQHPCLVFYNSTFILHSVHGVFPHWPSSMQNIMVSSIFVNELLLQIQYLRIKTGQLKWSYWPRNSKIRKFYKRNFFLRWIFTEIFFQIFIHEACLPKKTCVHGTLEMAPLNRASNAHEFCI